MIKFPAHECGLFLAHNEHKDYYQTVADRIRNEDHGCLAINFVSPEQMQKAIDTNEMWVLQWYPRTPITSYILSAADLDVLLAAALGVR